MCVCVSVSAAVSVAEPGRSHGGGLAWYLSSHAHTHKRVCVSSAMAV